MTVIYLVIAALLVFITASSSAETEHQKQRFHGVQKNGNQCVCTVRFAEWEFPVERFKELQDLSQNCSSSLNERLSEITAINFKIQVFLEEMQNETARLKQFEAMQKQRLYHPLNFWPLRWDLKRLQSEIAKVQNVSLPNTKALQTISSELNNSYVSVLNLQLYDKHNLLNMKDRLKKIKNRLESFSVYGNVKIGNCSGGMLRNVTRPLIAQLNPYGSSYPYGAWGMDSMPGSPELYWVMALLSSNIYGNSIRTYSSYKTFLMSNTHVDFTVESSYTTPNAIQGPGVVLYNGSLYYNCYKSGEMCKFNLNTKNIIHVNLPNAGHSNKFPYCYYDCYGYTDIDFSVDENGIWVIYATEENYGNIVLSKINSNNLAVLQTWKTKLFKKATSNAFMVCGVLYATRYVSKNEEEIFYMFDTVTNQEAKNLNIRLIKFSPDVASLHYNPVDRKLYLFNGGYMLSYGVLFS
ncbi:olfactomedin-4-like isoform X2 [Amblyraja radiata]|uniref:olfactomedin-4-like isoform X2 n=1 Tax=Amblyraja radiata TaxID=386614 RepID=UPI00140223A0|nr:olfactomedin-4-like isoform X2 [Amblyraja radiata]